MPMFEQDLEIAFHVPVVPGVFCMGLRSPEMVAVAEPGQFVMVRIGDRLDPLLRRPFSICGRRGREVFILLYAVVGQGTGLMSRLNAGERVSVLGPLGKGFEMAGHDSAPILVAGGIGIAPLFFLAQCLRPGPMTFLAGFGSAGQIIDPAPLGLGDLNMEIATDDGTRGHHGSVTDLLKPHLNGAGDRKGVIYACGPGAMLRRTGALAREQGVPCQVSLETVMACGLGVCQGCAVPAAEKEPRSYHLVCQHGPVFQAEALDWKTHD